MAFSLPLWTGRYSIWNTTTTNYVCRHILCSKWKTRAHTGKYCWSKLAILVKSTEWNVFSSYNTHTCHTYRTYHTFTIVKSSYDLNFTCILSFFIAFSPWRFHTRRCMVFFFFECTEWKRPYICFCLIRSMGNIEINSKVKRFVTLHSIFPKKKHFQTTAMSAND